MTEDEFKRQYARMADLYGDKDINHYKAWLDRFGLWTCVDFADAVTDVIDNHRSMASDKWPTIGDFNHIVSTLPRSEEPEELPFKDDKERAYMQIQWRIKQLPLAERNIIRKKACLKATNRDVPWFMEKACGCQEPIIDAVLQNLEVRIFCEEKGIRCPV